MSLRMQFINANISMEQNNRVKSPGRDYRREFDAIYPEHLSRLNRVNDQHSIIYRKSIRKKLSRSGRYRTTPITIDEIKEVDEETEDFSDSEECSSKSDNDLHKQFEQFAKRRKRRIFRKGEELMENHTRNDIIEVVEPDSGLEDIPEPFCTKVSKKAQLKDRFTSRIRTTSSSL